MSYKIQISRALLKTLTYRVVSLTSMIVIAYIFTGNIFASAGIGIVDVFGGALLYYIHERIWERKR